jgi:hypothetical protein
MIRVGVAFERVGWAIAFALGTTAVFTWQPVEPEPIRKSSRPLAQTTLLQSPTTESFLAAVREVTAGNPFRTSRRPSSLPFGTDVQTAEQSQPPRQPHPALVLAGIVGGPPWVALLEGVPGRDGPVAVRRGDTIAGLSVGEITSQGAVIASVDTVWKLTLKRISP